MVHQLLPAFCQKLCPDSNPFNKPNPKIQKIITLSLAGDSPESFCVSEESLYLSPNLDSTKLYFVETDASNYLLGAILSQHTNRGLHPIAYYSRKFIAA